MGTIPICRGGRQVRNVKYPRYDGGAPSPPLPMPILPQAKSKAQAPHPGLLLF